jgi:hypothetical protein
VIDDEDHPEMRRATEELARALTLLTGRRLTGQFMIDLNGVITDHRAKWRTRGVDFPVLAAMVVPRIGAISLMRADLTSEAVASRIVQFAREHPGATSAEIAQAVAWVFPEYRPDDSFMRRMRAQMEARRDESGHQGDGENAGGSVQESEQDGSGP